ncbi:hypothetical protein AALD01_02640 [Oscillospiraceae bacterium 21-37]
MAKEFDIYLNRRLTECDIIVYSIPYRDGLTVMERLILQTCLESYTLQKFVAIEAGSELVAHIDEMIKECREKLDAPLAFGNSADFEVHYALNPVSSKLILNSDTTKFLCNTFASAQNVLEFTASSVYAQTKKPFGKAHTEIEITAELKESLKNALEQAHSRVVPSTSLAGINKLGIIRGYTAVEPGATMVDLLYRIYTAASGGITIAAAALETEIHFSLGSGQSQLELSDRIIGECSIKQNEVASCLKILSELTDTLVACIQPTEATLEFFGQVNPFVKRHRILSEMDADQLVQYDDMSLDDVDYVVLQS